jgi:hypothetical protein
MRQCTLQLDPPCDSGLIRTIYCKQDLNYLQERGPDSHPRQPCESRPLSPRPAPVEYTAGLIEGKWSRAINRECCKPNTESHPCGITLFSAQPCVAERYPTEYRVLQRRCADGLWRSRKIRWGATRTGPTGAFPCGDSSRTLRQIRAPRNARPPDTAPRKKFKLFKAILAKILTIPTF